MVLLLLKVLLSLWPSFSFPKDERHETIWTFMSMLIILCCCPPQCKWSCCNHIVLWKTGSTALESWIRTHKDEGMAREIMSHKPSRTPELKVRCDESARKTDSSCNLEMWIYYKLICLAFHLCRFKNVRWRNFTTRPIIQNREICSKGR